MSEVLRTADNGALMRTLLTTMLQALALLRVVGCVLIEAHDEWQVTDRRYLSQVSMAQLTPPAPTVIGAGPDTPSEVIDQPALQTAQSATTRR